MSEIDKHGRLEEEPFSFRVNKEGKVFIFWEGRQVLVLRDKAASQFVRQVTGADTQSAQLLMAKATGNFKRGNERKQAKEG